MNDKYLKITEIMVSILPLIENKNFALKGGTAINLFIQDLPRLSIDIDLTYLPVQERKKSYEEIHSYLDEVTKTLSNKGFHVTQTSPNEARLIAQKRDIKIYIEPNYIVRGSLYPPERRNLSKKSAETFRQSLSFLCLSKEDVYGGKFIATLTRQHPRDLFDVKMFFQKDKITKKLKNSFLFYLISCPKPFYEILMPKKQNIERSYQDHFHGMSLETSIEKEDLDDAFYILTKELKKSLTKRDIDLLISILSLSPDWSLYDFPEIANYPSIKWRLYNINKMSETKRKKETSYLEEYLK